MDEHRHIITIEECRKHPQGLWTVGDGRYMELGTGYVAKAFPRMWHVLYFTKYSGK